MQRLTDTVESQDRFRFHKWWAKFNLDLGLAQTIILFILDGGRRKLPKVQVFVARRGTVWLGERSPEGHTQAQCALALVAQRASGTEASVESEPDLAMSAPLGSGPDKVALPRSCKRRVVSDSF